MDHDPRAVRDRVRVRPRARSRRTRAGSSPSPSRAAACPGRRAGTKPQPDLARRSRAPSQKPRASAPSTRSGSPLRRPRGELVDRLPQRGRVEQERRDVLEADARLGEVRDLADARLQIDRRHASLTGESTDVPREEELGQLVRGLAPAPGGPRARRAAAPGCASAAPARRAPRAGPSRGRRRCGTRAGGAARSRSARASRTRPRCRRRSRSRAAGRPRRAARAGRTPRAPARGPARCPRARRAPRGRAPPPARRAPRRRRRRSFARARRELLADHAQRQELVALEAQDRLEPLDVVLAEQAVAALRALRRQQPLILEVADLRDRDVRELGLQAPADGADRQQPRLGVLGRSRTSARGGRSGGICRSGARRRPRARPTRRACG